MSQKRHSILVFSYFMTFLQLRFQAENAMLLQQPAPILALILCGWVGREGGGPMIGWPRIKRSLQSHVGGGGQYKMYKNIIFINLISRSKKVKPKMLTCVWSLCSGKKLLKLWHFVSVLTYKFWISWREGTERTLLFSGHSSSGRQKGHFYEG